MDFVNRAKALDGGGCLLEKGCGSLSWVAWDLGMSRNVHSFHFFSIITQFEDGDDFDQFGREGGVYMYIMGRHIGGMVACRLTRRRERGAFVSDVAKDLSLRELF